jgi:hypothetical protein
MPENMLYQPPLLETLPILRLKETRPMLPKPREINVPAYRMPLQFRATETMFMTRTTIASPP